MCANGTCQGRPRRDGIDCNDHNPCTKHDACESGTCQGTARPDGAECDAHSNCVPDALCVEGVCTADPATEVTCAAPDQCHVGVCDPGTGGCYAQAKLDGTTCTDGSAATDVVETCEGGTCRECTEASYDVKPRFVDNGDMTVTDRKLCLVLEQESGAGTGHAPGFGTPDAADPQGVDNR